MLLLFTSLALAGPRLTVEVKPDLRECPAPTCGGWWLHTVNQARSTCLDGSRERWCYVAQIDWRPLARDLSDEALLEVQSAAAAEQVLLHGELSTFDWADLTFAELTVDRAWVDSAR